MYKIAKLKKLRTKEEILEMLEKCLNSEHGNIGLPCYDGKCLQVEVIKTEDILEAIKMGNIEQEGVKNYV